MMPRRFVALLTVVAAACSGAEHEGAVVDVAASQTATSDGEPATEAPPFALPADGALPKLRKVLTEHLGQLTTTQQNRNWENGIVGTDLGASFERDGKVVYIFGDSWTPGGARQDQDSIAWAPATDGAIPPKLNWVVDGGNQFVAPRLPGVNLGGMNVPMEGIPAGDKTYVFFTSGWSGATNNYTNSVLAEMKGLDVAGMKLVHNVVSKKFFNVSALVEGATVFIYGSGRYRQSPVYLAKVPLAKIGDRSQWQYSRGGTFGPGEDSAQPIISTPCVGELSVRKWEKIGLYFMAYNCGTPRGIALRWSRTPDGPWSDPINIFDPGRDADGGYEHFIHAKESVAGHDDGLSEPGRYEEWGGEYGPYFVPRYFTEEPSGVLSLVYVMSSWNPYQAHMMRTQIVLEGNDYKAKPHGVDLPPAKLVNGDFANGLSGWQGSGFTTFTGTDGKPRITSYVGGDGNTGKIWQDFQVDATTKELRFAVHGGDARVVLLRGNEVVRATQARRTNDSELQAVWNLTKFRGDTVRLQVEDNLTGPWGFISVSGFELK
jgi:hypothetical protein